MVKFKLFKAIADVLNNIGKTTLAKPDFKEIEPASVELAKKTAAPVGSAYSKVPAMWQWLIRLPGLPKMVAEGLKEYGTIEGSGSTNNKKIISWADEIARIYPTTYTNWAADWYNKDSVPWCGLFTALIACRSANGNKARMPVNSYLSSLAWAGWGEAVDWKGKLNNVWMGDVAVFVREGGGHVGIVIGISTDGTYVVLLAGNQDNAVNIKMVSTSRLYAVRRPKYHVRPESAKHFRINSKGISTTKTEA